MLLWLQVLCWYEWSFTFLLSLGLLCSFTKWLMQKRYHLKIVNCLEMNIGTYWKMFRSEFGGLRYRYLSYTWQNKHLLVGSLINYWLLWGFGHSYRLQIVQRQKINSRMSDNVDFQLPDLAVLAGTGKLITSLLESCGEAFFWQAISAVKHSKMIYWWLWTLTVIHTLWHTCYRSPLMMLVQSFMRRCFRRCYIQSGGCSWLLLLNTATFNCLSRVRWFFHQFY